MLGEVLLAFSLTVFLISFAVPFLLKRKEFRVKVKALRYTVVLILSSILLNTYVAATGLAQWYFVSPCLLLSFISVAVIWLLVYRLWSD